MKTGPAPRSGCSAWSATGLPKDRPGAETALRQHLNPIDIMLNNSGYGADRFILEGSFYDIRNWNCHPLPELLGGGLGESCEQQPSIPRMRENKE